MKHYLGTVRLLQPKTKQSSICQHGEYGLPAPKCPQPRFRARDLHALFNKARCDGLQRRAVKNVVPLLHMRAEMAQPQVADQLWRLHFPGVINVPIDISAHAR